MDLPELHSDEELALLNPAEQLEYAKGLAAKAHELLTVARSSFTVPAGPSGAEALSVQDKMGAALNNLGHMLTQAGVTLG